MLKEQIKRRFKRRLHHVEQVFEYAVHVQCEGSEAKASLPPSFASSGGLSTTIDSSFSTTILSFFKARIVEQYPLPSATDLRRSLSLVALERKPHELFVDLRSSTSGAVGLALDPERERIHRSVLSYVAAAENSVFTITRGGQCGAGGVAATAALSLGEVQRSLAAFLAPCDGNSSAGIVNDEGNHADVTAPVPQQQAYSRRILVLSGAAGAGKSSLLASCVNRIGGCIQLLQMACMLRLTRILYL
jgi:hypothetical protein